VFEVSVGVVYVEEVAPDIALSEEQLALVPEYHW
jgi:hypothetical protein